MNAKTRVIILKTIMVIEVTGGIVLVVKAAKMKSLPVIYYFAFIALAVLWLVLLYFVPVRCSKPRCPGQMKRNWIKEFDGEERLQYVCSDCGEIYETGISVGLGAPY